MATGLEGFIGLYQPQTFTQAMEPFRQQMLRQQQINLAKQKMAEEQELMPFRKQLLQAQAAKAMRGPAAPVFQQKLQALGQMLGQAGVPEEDVAKAQQLMLLRDALGGGGGMQTSVTTPSGETVQIGQGGGGYLSALPQSIQEKLGMGGQAQFGVEAGTQKSRSGFGGAVTVGPEGLKSQPTTASTSRMQQQLQSVGNAESALEALAKSKPKYQNLIKSGLATAGGYISRVLGGEGAAASEMAETEQDLVNAVESYITAYNLPKTNETVAMVHRALSPRGNESPKGYEKRLRNEINKIKQRKQSIAQGLRGIPLDGRKKQQYKQEDLDFTAKKYGISVEEVKRRLGMQ